MKILSCPSIQPSQYIVYFHQTGMWFSVLRINLGDSHRSSICDQEGWRCGCIIVTRHIPKWFLGCLLKKQGISKLSIENYPGFSTGSSSAVFLKCTICSVRPYCKTTFSIHYLRIPRFFKIIFVFYFVVNDPMCRELVCYSRLKISTDITQARFFHKFRILPSLLLIGLTERLFS